MVKNPPVNTGDLSWIPGLGRLPGEGNSNPFRCSGLGNPMKEPRGLRSMGWGCKEADVPGNKQQEVTARQSGVLLAWRITSSKGMYLKYTFPHYFFNLVFSATMVDNDDLQLQCDILREPVRQGKGSISVNVKDTAHSVFEIAGVKRAQ